MEIKQYIPSILKKKLTGLIYGWRGNYKSWEEALKKCTGYDDKLIVEKVKQSLLKVKNGEAVFERDSVLFNEIQYSFPLLPALGVIAVQEKELHVLDFGGSLGSSYFQNKHFFINQLLFSWNIVEQPHFVETGKKYFEDEFLKFYFSINDCIKEKKINVLVLSSVVQYLPYPFKFINEIINHQFKYILVDRTPVMLKGNSRITIQRVPKKIYNAQYPCWLLNEQELLNMFTTNYNCHFNTFTSEEINYLHAAFKAYFFQLN
jgi:putative methyltransferase (TIGR04325 family)